jgi:uncharacterized membrane protein HdeD (DUF308 family)
MNASMEEIQEQDSRSAVVLAIVLIFLGFLAIILPAAMSVGLMRLLALLILIDGIVQLVHVFRSRGSERFVWKLVVALLYAGVGIYLLVHPLMGLASLTLLLAIFFFAEGAMDIFTYIFAFGSARSTWLLLHGIVAFILGLLIWRGWPFSSFRVIGTIVGISILLTGITRLMMALEVRKLAPAHSH